MRIASFCILVIALAELGATDCDGGSIDDPRYDLWCGNSLCAWKLVRGQIFREATWHDGDPGVSFGSLDTTIEQFTPVSSHGRACVRFDLIAKVVESAQLSLDVDVYGDGTIERSFPLATTTWQPVSYQFTVEPPFTGIRFAFTMRNFGTAILARMYAHVLPPFECPGTETIRGGPAPLGALCDTAADCASQICVDAFFTSTCGACDPLAPMCAGGQICGLDDPGPPERGVPLACVTPGKRELSEGCFAAAECTTGICQLGVCSICRSGAECDSGQHCFQAWSHGPSMCSSASQTSERGEPCATDFECASSACLGKPRRQCFDGRSCTSDANCPVDGSLAPGHCLIVGVQGGTCG
ncbi:MAG TPA: hypothetical protein VLM79_05960 [Kofleriaceae bacterium]|nr:hypothetical protein [Kofleriaceae bacterium]